jgi:hypothetical protein
MLWYAADVHGTAASVNASWFVDAGWLTGADTTAPQLRSARVTPVAVHEGNVCAKGPACQQGEDRRLLDYPWLDLDAEGRAHLVFASTKWDKLSAFAVYAGEASAPAGAASASTPPPPPRGHGVRDPHATKIPLVAARAQP